MAEVGPERAVPCLEMRRISRRFGATVALDRVDLEVDAGQVRALIGENGAGKSTLMKILSGALPPDAGTMRLAGEAYRPSGALEARRRGVAMVYQELSLAPHLTVQENLLLGVEPTAWGVLRRSEGRHRVTDALQQLEHPEIEPETRVGALPLAAQQLVEIARALVLQCRVLVLDEPTSSLAQDDAARLFALIRRLQSRGLAVLYVSHFLEEVAQVADRYTVLRDGRRVAEGPVAATSRQDLVELMVGRRLQGLFPRRQRAIGPVVLEAIDLWGRSRPAGAGFELRRGEILGLAGLVGAGRTELLRALFGLDPVRRGAVRVGVYQGPAGPRQRWAQGVGMLSEDRKGEGLAGGMSLADNLTLSRLQGLGRWGTVGPDRQAAAARRWIEALDIRCRGPGQQVAALSGGNQQKVALARLLHHDVDVLLLDEPTRGIDVASRAQLYERIDRLAARGKAVLWASSYLPELLGMADRIAVMCRGRLGTPRPAGELDERAVMLEATGPGAPCI